MNSCVQFGKAQEFSPVDSSSVWEVGDMRDTETVICDVEQEVEVDEDLPPWASSDSAAAPEKSFSTLQRKMTLSDILRGVKVREDTLQSAVARLGGGTRGVQMLLEHVNHWALKSQDEEDVMVAIRRGIVDLGMPPAPQRHHNPEISTTSGDGNGVAAKGSPRGTCEIVNQGPAFTRALRKSHMVRQRRQTRTQQRHHPTRIKGENQSRQCRLSTSDDHRKQVDMESEFSNKNGTGCNFLFQKVLRASDVSSLGRIVLPKKDAERHLPFLVERDGILLSFQDYHCGKFWTARYRFWPNNRSRMYLLENIGDFVNFYHLQEGDLLLCYRNYQGGYVLRGEKVLPNVKNPAVKGLCSKLASPATDLKTVTTVMPATHQIVEGEIPSGTHNANLANSSSASSYCTSGETGDAKYCQDGDRDHQDCFSQQSGKPPCSGDVRTNSPATYKPLVHDEDPYPGVAMLYVSNVKQRYLDENQFL